MPDPTMIPLILCCIAAASLSAALITHMIRVGVMDVPGHRSSHARPTPKGGGIGVVTGFLLVFPLSQLWTQGDLPGPALLLPLSGVALLALFSWLDDVHSYRAALKLGMQGIAAVLVLFGVGLMPLPGGGASAFADIVSGSFSIAGLPALLGTGWTLGLIAFGAGFIWLVYTTNALNFIDGINGLASGVMAISALALALVFTRVGAIADAHAALILAVTLLAFLPFNFPRARIFMGDVGSQGAGLALAWLGIEAGLVTPYRLILPFLLCGVLYDVAFTLLRRALAGDALAQAHRSHLYQLAVRSGVSPVVVTVVHWVFAVWGGGICLQPWPLWFRLIALLAPQLLWTAFVIQRARGRDLGKW
ncbi:undecaprenyl-phosphate alpha N-acetylglucosaminyltransferase [Asaia krungthepensis NRIC 0535]|uniref:Undecaprenyl-phosphate alpha N-acetylglucosaminyltransferase n=2 Tax=Asaia krungthepensis TaxID=220990 RepID=A0ABQ0Q5H6_9PROT|nr:undecaprenyl-phosphate alpha N-acetylglucosaminyltransferase [Asaia krungthepensis NRIC 0535]